MEERGEGGGVRGFEGEREGVRERGRGGERGCGERERGEGGERGGEREGVERGG